MMRNGSRRSNRMMSMPDVKGSRTQGIVILLLLIALIVLAVLAIPSIRYRAEADTFLASRMLIECNNAIQRVQRLSRNASSTSGV